MLRDDTPSRLVQAPPRGGYDRARSRAERHLEQRERLLIATAEMFDGRSVTVGRIVEHAGVSRNTFYEHFDDAEHALAAVEQRALELFARAASDTAGMSRTPFDQLRSLSRAWIDVVVRYAHFAEIALRAIRPAASLSPAGRQFLDSLRDAVDRARQDALVVAEPAVAALIAAAGSAEALGRSCLVGEVSADAAAHALFEVVARTLH